MVCTAFNQDALGLAAWTPLHSITLHGIHCIHSGCFWPCCIKSTAFKYSAGIHCLQSCCIKSPAFNRVPFLHAALNTLHSIMLQGIHGIQTGCILQGCMESTAFNDAAWNPLHLIGMLWPCCIKSNAFTQDAFVLTAWSPLNTIGIHCTTMQGVFCIQ